MKLDKRAEKIKSVSGLSVELSVGVVNDTVNYWGAVSGRCCLYNSDIYLDNKDRVLYLDFEIGELKISEFNCLYITPFIETTCYIGYVDSYFWANTLDVLGKKGTIDDPTIFLENEIVSIVRQDSVSNGKNIRFYIKATESLDQVDSIDLKLYATDPYNQNKEHSSRLKYDWLEADSIVNASTWCKINRTGRNGYDIATIELDAILLIGYSIDSVFVSLNDRKTWYTKRTPVKIANDI
ncbi:hypothetical protein [Bacteroides sp. 519]|uniref:hypothetical protein n=1 Tax=Bacteroides sp. 519 TaxID=2302937 RepID=UPI0019402DD8|nr:hypothetical protein [Bacteroides sp. 519]